MYQADGKGLQPGDFLWSTPFLDLQEKGLLEEDWKGFISKIRECPRPMVLKFLRLSSQEDEGWSQFERITLGT